MIIVKLCIVNCSYQLEKLHNKNNNRLTLSNPVVRQPQHRKCDSEPHILNSISTTCLPVISSTITKRYLSRFRLFPLVCVFTLKSGIAHDHWQASAAFPSQDSETCNCRSEVAVATLEASMHEKPSSECNGDSSRNCSRNHHSRTAIASATFPDCIGNLRRLLGRQSARQQKTSTSLSAALHHYSHAFILYS